MIAKCKDNGGIGDCPFLKSCLPRINDPTISGCSMPFVWTGMMKISDAEVEHTVVAEKEEPPVEKTKGAETMQRLIDADPLIEPLKEEYKKVKQAFDETSVFKAPNDVALYGALMQEVGAVIGMIEDAKTIDAEPVRHGKWITEECLPGVAVCSICGHEIRGLGCQYTKYCDECGARMDEDDKS